MWIAQFPQGKSPAAAGERMASTHLCDVLTKLECSFSVHFWICMQAIYFSLKFFFYIINFLFNFYTSIDKKNVMFIN